MAMPRANYNFQVNGVDIHSLKKLRDFDLGQRERVNRLWKILYDEDGRLIPYLQMFFDDDLADDPMSVLNPTKTKPLSHDVNICKGLESLANYILYSPDGERLNKKTLYNIYKDEKEFRKNNEAKYLDKDMEGLGVDEVLDVLVMQDHNEYLEKNQKIFAKDFKRHKVLLDYEDAINYLLKLLPEETDATKRYLLGNTISDLRKEQCELKSLLDRTIIFKHLAKSGEKLSEPDIDGFDYASVERMFRNANPKQITPFGDLYETLCLILGRIELSDFEKQILSLIPAEKKPNFSSIARKLCVEPRAVRQVFLKLRNKIIDEYMKMHELYWYTFEDYGWWKTCESCGEPKLLSTTYWHKNSGSNDGFRSICKKCSDFGKKQE